MFNGTKASPQIVRVNIDVEKSAWTLFSWLLGTAVNDPPSRRRDHSARAAAAPANQKRWLHAKPAVAVNASLHNHNKKDQAKKYSSIINQKQHTLECLISNSAISTRFLRKAATLLALKSISSGIGSWFGVKIAFVVMSRNQHTSITIHVYLYESIPSEALCG